MRRCLWLASLAWLCACGVPATQVVDGEVASAGNAAATAGATMPAGAWGHQFGTPGFENAFGIAVDAGGSAVVVGSTDGRLFEAATGGHDGFVVKFGPDGRQRWSRQLGGTAADGAHGVAFDAWGSVFVTGYTFGPTFGPSAGGFDAYVVKLHSSGSTAWATQFGTTQEELGWAVAVDARGHVFVAGRTQGDLGGPNQGGHDAFVAKLGPSGNLLWARQFGSPAPEEAVDVAVDADGNVAVVAWTEGSLFAPLAGRRDGFVVMLDANGERLWARQLGSGSVNDAASGVAVTREGGVAVVGTTFGSPFGPSAGCGDAYVVVFDASGAQVWARQLGSDRQELGSAIAVDAAGHLWVAGATYGRMGDAQAGEEDVFVTKLTGAGELLWTRQFGTPGREFGNAVAVDAAGHAWVTGFTTGDLFGRARGGWDAYVARLAP